MLNIIETLLFCIQVNGFPVFGVGQPTEEGFLATLNKARASKLNGDDLERAMTLRLMLIAQFSRWPPAQPTLLRSLSGSMSGLEASMFI